MPGTTPTSTRQWLGCATARRHQIWLWLPVIPVELALALTAGR